MSKRAKGGRPDWQLSCTQGWPRLAPMPLLAWHARFNTQRLPRLVLSMGCLSTCFYRAAHVLIGLPHLMLSMVSASGSCTLCQQAPLSGEK